MEEQLQRLEEDMNEELRFLLLYTRIFGEGFLN